MVADCRGQLERFTATLSSSSVPGLDRCLQLRLRLCACWYWGVRIMGSSNRPRAYKLQGNSGRSFCAEVLYPTYGRQSCTSDERKRHNSGLRKQYGQPRQEIDQLSRADLGNPFCSRNFPGSQTCVWGVQRHSRPTQSLVTTVRVDVTPLVVRNPRQHVGTTQHRSLCLSQHRPTGEIQQLLSRPLDTRGIGRSRPYNTHVLF